MKRGSRKTMTMPKTKREMRKSGADNFAVKKAMGKGQGSKRARNKRLERETL